MATWSARNRLTNVTLVAEYRQVRSENQFTSSVCQCSLKAALPSSRPTIPTSTHYIGDTVRYLEAASGLRIHIIPTSTFFWGDTVWYHILPSISFPHGHTFCNKLSDTTAWRPVCGVDFIWSIQSFRKRVEANVATSVKCLPRLTKGSQYREQIFWYQLPGATLRPESSCYIT